MSTVSLFPASVHSIIPTDSDGITRLDLIPVAALLCEEGYHDSARARILDRLADGVSARRCVEDGALEPADLAAVEELLARGQAPYIAPISGGSPAADFDAALALDDLHLPVPARYTEYRTPDEWAALDWDAVCDAHDEEMAAIEAERPAPETTLSFPDWIASQAEVIRAHGSDAADWLAAHIELIAKRAAFVGASTPAEFEDRCEVLDTELAPAAAAVEPAPAVWPY